MTAALRILAYGVAADSTDEYVRIGESIAVESLKKFVKEVVNVFSEEYLKSPNSNDIARLVAVNEKREFLGMLGSIDCMHWKWKNYSTAWKYECDPNGVQQGDDYEQVLESISTTVSRERTTEVQNFIQSHIRIRDRETHSQLQDDLVEHLWQLHGQSWP
uniref:Nuclease HARBI1 n=1 Tax=Fagus sylvatica TaxID=28930 RepID=A0A2N9EE81_FAGSY